MKYKVGDRVRIKSLDWYNKNKDSNGNVVVSSIVSRFSWCKHVRTVFTKDMTKFCGKVVTIETVWTVNYSIVEGTNIDYFTDEMIEGLVEEETEPNIIEEAKTYWDSIKDAWICPKGYIFKDENGNVINATKIILEKKPDDKLKLESTKKVREYWSEYTRIFIEIYEDEPNECVLTHLYTLEDYRQKGYGRQALIEAELIAKELGCHTAYLKVETNSWMHEWYLRMGYKWYKTADKEYTWLVKNLTSIEEKKKEYPKTYEECYQVTGLSKTSDIYGYKNGLLFEFQKLLIARDAYWKIAGAEMGLGKPWELSIGTPIYYIYYNRTVGTIKNDYADDIQCNIILAFPTEEMRDAFKENFKELINSCKELL